MAWIAEEGLAGVFGRMASPVRKADMQIAAVLASGEGTSGTRVGRGLGPLVCSVYL